MKIHENFLRCYMLIKKEQNLGLRNFLMHFLFILLVMMKKQKRMEF